jgi:hypothetical protein
MNRLVIPTATLFYTFVQTLFVVSTSFDNVFKLLFLIFIAWKAREAEEPQIRISVWLAWTLHSWLPPTTESVLPAVAYPLFSLVLFMASKKGKLRHATCLLLCILTLFDVESRACHYGTVLCILKTFIYWFEDISAQARNEAAKVNENEYTEATAVEMSCLLWSHPLLMPLYFLVATKRLYKAFQAKKRL